ncbi:MAG TPA: ATPase [Firmicutes bacterium]|nr:ATPase [Bacillota bacterium]
MSTTTDVKNLSGLTNEEAQRRLATEGPNELPSARKRTLLHIALEVVREPMFLLLVGCGALYLLLGDHQEALMLLSFVFVVMGITIYQERKTENALEALRDLSSPRALVIRDGQQRRIPGREVVRGDIVLVSEGDRIPADSVLMWAINLSVNESLLTGESLPVRKSPVEAPTESIELERPGGEDTPFLYSGTLVVQGQGVAEVKCTGARTEIGRIGKALQTVETEETALSRETGRMVRTWAMLGFVLFAAVVVVYGLTRGNWIQGLLAGITLAMAMLPEESPVVLTIFLALGAWRMSRKNVLTRRTPAIETLGAATVLCVDKTGTLTQNRMSVSRLLVGDRCYDADRDASDLPEEFHELIEFGVLASEKDPFDPMEQALRQFGQRHLVDTEHLHDDWTLVQEYALSRELLALSHVWMMPNGNGGRYVVAAKGAPEAIADLCHLTAEAAEALLARVSQMAADGLRVLGVAKAEFKAAELPVEQHGFPFELVGLIGLADPVRPAVRGAIEQCYQAGIRVAMITGDYPGTAQNIARQIGLSPADQVITGPELSTMSDEDLGERVKTCCIFARMVPEQKLRLVEALKANGEIVAMTGDGVNDAPALKSAHIGIAMGGRGTDVAREAASLVLLDDDFSSIVEAVRQGRRIYDNLRKAMAYIFAIHVPIAGLSLLPVLLEWPLVLLPVHIAFLELIIDPACSVVFEMEPEEEDVMNRPPRDPSSPLFGSRLMRVGIVQGLSVLAFVMAVYVISLLVLDRGELEARSLTFTTLVLANLGLIMANRSWSGSLLSQLRTPNPAVRWVVGGSLAFLAAVLSIKALRGLFHLTVLHPVDIAICLVAGVLSVLWFEVFKASRGMSRA